MNGKSGGGSAAGDDPQQRCGEQSKGRRRNGERDARLLENKSRMDGKGEGRVRARMTQWTHLDENEPASWGRKGR